MLRHINFGNIYKNSFTQIINSKESKAWIDAFSKMKNNICRNCEKKNIALVVLV